MKMNLKKKRLPMRIFMLSATLLALMGCSGTANIEDYIGVTKAADFDPSKPVTITGFTPESGSVGQQVVIYGSNFGNDPEIVDLKIGNKPAVVVSVKGDCLYTYVPSKAFAGKVEITIGTDQSGKQSCVAEKQFEYERNMVVGRLCGYKNADDSQGWLDGPFEGEDGVRCAGFRNDGVMQFSPYNHDQLFIVYDQEPYFGTTAHGVQLLDLAKRRVDTILPLGMFNDQRLRTIDFAVDPFQYTESGQMVGYADQQWVLNQATPRELRWREHLILSADNGDNNKRTNSVYIVDRDRNGEFSSNSRVTPLANYVQCNGASLLPYEPFGETYHKELYFTSYAEGEVIRLDMDTYWDCIYNQAMYDPDTAGPNEQEPPSWDPYVLDNKFGGFEILYTIQDKYWEFQINFHPGGKYAYIVVINQVYVLRTDYDPVSRKLLPPYLIAGSMKNRGFVDGVGASAQFCRPYQGTFIKNEEYEAENKADIYDFYLCDNSWDRDHTGSVTAEAHAIRLITPEGIVRTYAGGSRNTHADGRPYGSENGELRDVARFDRPTGIVNDVHVDKVTGNNTLIFYILDTMNRQIRTITIEEPEDEEGEEGAEGNE